MLVLDDFLREPTLANAVPLPACRAAILHRDALAFLVQHVPMVLHVAENMQTPVWEYLGVRNTINARIRWTPDGTTRFISPRTSPDATVSTSTFVADISQVRLEW